MLLDEVILVQMLRGVAVQRRDVPIVETHPGSHATPVKLAAHRLSWGAGIPYTCAVALGGRREVLELLGQLSLRPGLELSGTLSTHTELAAERGQRRRVVA